MDVIVRVIHELGKAIGGGIASGGDIGGGIKESLRATKDGVMEGLKGGGLGDVGKGMGKALGFLGIAIVVFEILKGAFQVVQTVIGAIFKMLSLLIMPFVNLLLPFLIPILYMLKPIVMVLNQLLRPILMAMMAAMRGVMQAGGTAGAGMIAGVGAMAGALGELLWGLLKLAFLNVIKMAGDLIFVAVLGIVTGIKDLMKGIIDTITFIVDTVLNILIAAFDSSFLTKPIADALRGVKTDFDAAAEGAKEKLDDIFKPIEASIISAKKTWDSNMDKAIADTTADLTNLFQLWDDTFKKSISTASDALYGKNGLLPGFTAACSTGFSSIGTSAAAAATRAKAAWDAIMTQAYSKYGGYITKEDVAAFNSAPSINSKLMFDKSNDPVEKAIKETSANKSVYIPKKK